MCITRTPPRVTTKPAAAWRGLCKGVYVLPGYTIAGEQAAGSGTKGLSVHPCTRSNLGSALQELRRKHIRPPRTTDFKCRPAVDVARASLSRAWLPGSRPSPHPCTMPVVSTALGAPQAWQEMAQPAQRTAHSATHGRNGARNGATATHSWRDKREWRRYEGTKDMAHKEDNKGTNMCKTNQCTRCHSATLPLQQDPLILWLRILLSNLMSR